MATGHRCTDGNIVDLNVLSTASAPRAHGLGETHSGDGMSTWVYVQASGTVPQGALCVIEPNYTFAAYGGDAAAQEGEWFGFAQTAFTVSQSGFLAISGNSVLVRVQGSVSEAGQVLYSESSGEVSSASVTASCLQLFGIYLHSSVSASGATATVVTAQVSFPGVRYKAVN